MEFVATKQTSENFRSAVFTLIFPNFSTRTAFIAWVVIFLVIAFSLSLAFLLGELQACCRTPYYQRICARFLNCKDFHRFIKISANFYNFLFFTGEEFVAFKNSIVSARKFNEWVVLLFSLSINLLLNSCSLSNSSIFFSDSLVGV